MVQRAVLAKGQVEDHRGVGASMRAALEAALYDPEAEAHKKDIWDQLEHNLTLHPPESEIVKIHMDRLRSEAKAFGRSILSFAPESRERSLALTNLEQTLQWSIAAIARNQ